MKSNSRDRIRSNNSEYADVMFVLDDVRQELRDEILAARGEDNQEATESSYTTPYIELMHEAIHQFEIDPDNQPIKETLVEWFLERQIAGQKVSRATAEYLASFVRLPESRTGGNRPWKVKAQREKQS